MSTLNTVTPGSISSFTPVFSHDRKDNFQATKIVAKNPIDQINSMVESPEPFRLTVKPLPENHSIPKLKPSYVQPKHYCPLCHRSLESVSFCSHCFENFDDHTNLNPKPKEYKCSLDWCDRQYDTEKEKNEHELIDHPDIFHKKKKRRFDEFDEDAKTYYKRMALNCVSKIVPTTSPWNLAVNRKLNPKFEPDLYVSLSHSMRVENFISDDE